MAARQQARQLLLLAQRAQHAAAAGGAAAPAWPCATAQAGSSGLVSAQQEQRALPWPTPPQRCVRAAPLCWRALQTDARPPLTAKQPAQAHQQDTGTSGSGGSGGSGGQQQGQQQGQQRRPAAPVTALQRLTSLPNLLSLSRVAAAPVVAWQLTTGQWAPAAALLAASGVTDWADGAAARYMGDTSKLGSYLDPLADKVLVVTTFGTLGALQLVPAWLAGLVVVRDAAQVGVTIRYRMAMFGGRWPGFDRFIDVDNEPAMVGGGGGGGGGAAAAAGGGAAAGGSGVSGAAADAVERGAVASSGGGSIGGAAAPSSGSSSSSSGDDNYRGPADMPRMRPLLVSKLNTVLAFALAGGAVARQWQGLPGEEVLAALEVAVAATTGASGVAYLWLWRQGRLLQK